MDGKREVLSASAFADAIEVVRRAFTRENLGDLDSLAAQVLVVVAAEPRISVRECAQRLSAGQPNVSSALSRLEKLELLTRDVKAGDSRTKALQLTPKGKKEARRFLEAGA